MKYFPNSIGTPLKSSKNLLSVFLFWGGLNGFLAVALGAFGAHALKERLTANDTLSIWQTASHYHLIHAVTLVLVALLADKIMNASLIRKAGTAFLLGIAVFSGSLYALALTNVKVLGAITPLGGLCLMAGWVLLLITGVQNMSSEK